VVSLYKAGKGQSALQIKAGAGAWHACSGSDKATPPSRTHKGGVFLRAPAPARRRFFVLACVRCVCVVEPCSTSTSTNEGVCVFRAVKTRERRPRARGLAPCFFHGMGTVAVCEQLLSSIDPSATLSLSLSLETCCSCIRIRAVYPCFDFDTNPARSTERSSSCVQATRAHSVLHNHRILGCMLLAHLFPSDSETCRRLSSLFLACDTTRRKRLGRCRGRPAVYEERDCKELRTIDQLGVG
jgi:hypothetical protein